MCYVLISSVDLQCTNVVLTESSPLASSYHLLVSIFLCDHVSFFILYSTFMWTQVVHLAADKFVQDELVDRLNSINERLNTLRVESEEVKRS